MDFKNIKLLGYAALAVMILNLVLFASRKISGLIFWVVIALGALFAYKILPRIRQ